MKTITRIVGVVPTPVRILIAALIALALALAVRSRLSGVRARRLMRQRGQLLEDVGLLQAALLPVPPERVGPVATSVAYRPADGPGAGGDFYDVFALDDGRLAVIVGDVSGHGREALPHTALVRFTVRAYLEAGLPPRKALQTAGNVLERQLGGSFATVVAAVYHPRERTLTYASAGHPPPVVLGEGAGVDAAAGAIELTTVCSAPPVGAGMRTGTRETVISVPGPARLCFHTDGVTEARIGEDLFGSERLAGALHALGRQATPRRCSTASPSARIPARRHGGVPAARRGWRRRAGDRARAAGARRELHRQRARRALPARVRHDARRGRRGDRRGARGARSPRQRRARAQPRRWAAAGPAENRQRRPRGGAHRGGRLLGVLAMSKAPTLAPDAAMVLGIAATAIPFARTPDEEAERWLRLLRLHGEVGAALQALGVSEDSLRAHAKESVDSERFAEAVNPEHRDVIALVSEHAARAAVERDAAGITTVDVLML